MINNSFTIQLYKCQFLNLWLSFNFFILKPSGFYFGRNHMETLIWLFDSTGIPSNPNQPGGYSVRMENTLPLVTQAPAIQPLPMRPGVIAQVSAYFTRYWGKIMEISQELLSILTYQFRYLRRSKIHYKGSALSFLDLSAAVVQQNSTDPSASLAAGPTTCYELGIWYCRWTAEERRLGVRSSRRSCPLNIMRWHNLLSISVTVVFFVKGKCGHTAAITVRWWPRLLFPAKWLCQPISL